MPDLHVIAVLTAKPGSEEAVGSALRDLVGPTRQEEGCLSYDLFESTAASGTFVFVERWTDQASMDAHMTTDHVVTAFAAAGDHLAEAPVIHPLVPTRA